MPVKNPLGGVIRKHEMKNPVAVGMNGLHEMTAEQFKQWFLNTYDVNHDGKISREELAEAIRVAGRWFASWKSKGGIRCADQNHNGFIDPSELDCDNFRRFAEKHLGVRIHDH